MQRGEGDRWMKKREGNMEKEGKREMGRELLSLSVWNERMHERLLQTVESGVRVLPWGSLFRAIDFHPPPTISPPNTTNDQRAKEKGSKNERDGTRKRLTAALSLSFFHPSFPFHPVPYPPICLFCFSLSFILLRYSIPTASTYILTDMHLNQLLG